MNKKRIESAIEALVKSGYFEKKMDNSFSLTRTGQALVGKHYPRTIRRASLGAMSIIEFMRSCEDEKKH